MKYLQEQLEKERQSFEEKHKKEIGALKEQLQVSCMVQYSICRSLTDLVYFYNYY